MTCHKHKEIYIRWICITINQSKNNCQMSCVISFYKTGGLFLLSGYLWHIFSELVVTSSETTVECCVFVPSPWLSGELPCSLSQRTHSIRSTHNQAPTHMQTHTRYLHRYTVWQRKPTAYPNSMPQDVLHIHISIHNMEFSRCWTLKSFWFFSVGFSMFVWHFPSSVFDPDSSLRCGQWRQRRMHRFRDQGCCDYMFCLQSSGGRWGLSCSQTHARKEILTPIDLGITESRPSIGIQGLFF